MVKISHKSRVSGWSCRLLAQEDDKQIRIVQLVEILDVESEKPSYELLLDRIAFFLHRKSIVARALTLWYKLGKEEIVVGSQ